MNMKKMPEKNSKDKGAKEGSKKDSVMDKKQAKMPAFMQKKK